MIATAASGQASSPVEAIGFSSPASGTDEAAFRLAFSIAQTAQRSVSSPSDAAKKVAGSPENMRAQVEAIRETESQEGEKARARRKQAQADLNQLS